MADFIPNQGEANALQKILNQTLYMGLMQNTPTEINGLGEAIVWADIVPSVGYVGGDEKTLSYGSWTIPTGAQAGNPATYAQQEFVADTGGADPVSGYYIRTADATPILLVVGVNSEVAASGVLKTMLAGARYRVNPQYGAE